MHPIDFYAQPIINVCSLQEEEVLNAVNKHDH